MYYTMYLPTLLIVSLALLTNILKYALIIQNSDHSDSGREGMLGLLLINLVLGITEKLVEIGHLQMQ